MYHTTAILQINYCG